MSVGQNVHLLNVCQADVRLANVCRPHVHRLIICRPNVFRPNVCRSSVFRPKDVEPKKWRHLQLIPFRSKLEEDEANYDLGDSINRRSAERRRRHRRR
jgi:hypothetical protein